MPAAASDIPRVLLVCSGLDHARRGFESFARECFDALCDEPALDLELVKGSGATARHERSVRTLTRDSPVAQVLGRMLSREPFRIEQVAFGLSLQSLLARGRAPDVVYFSEWHTGLVLAFLRRVTGRRFKLVYCNGAMATEGFGHLDHVQELTPAALAEVLQRGADPGRHTLLPYGFAIQRHPTLLSDQERTDLRRRLGLPADRRILLSVAALNRHHKRLDYLIEEVARLPEPRPFVLLVGQVEAETASIRALALRALGEQGHSVRTVALSEIADIYRASDVFALTSLGESFGRVLAEALAAGLPCLAHDYGTTRFVLGEQGRLADFSIPGSLTRLLQEDLREHDPRCAAQRHRAAYESFSWDHLRPRYVSLLRRAAAPDTDTGPAARL